MKNIEEMSDHEILMELIREKRRNDKIRNVKYGIYALIGLALIVLGCIYIPKIMALIEKYNRIIDEMDETRQTIEQFVNSFGTDTGEKIKEMVEGLNKLFGKFGF